MVYIVVNLYLMKLNKFYQGNENVFAVPEFIKKKYEGEFITLYEKYSNNKIHY